MKYTIAFDIYGTLVNSSSLYTYLQNIVNEDSYAFVESWRNKQLEYTYLSEMREDMIDFTLCTQEALDYCCSVYDVKLSDEQKTELTDIHKNLPLLPDAYEQLKRLHLGGHRLFALSHGNTQMVEQLLEKRGVISFFEDVLSIEHIHMLQSSPLVFEYFNLVTYSLKQDSLLISTNPIDIMSAVSYGMKTAWMTDEEFADTNDWELQPDQIIYTLEDLRL